MIRISAYNNASASSKKLAQELGCKLLRHRGSKFRGRPHHWVINWGQAATALSREVLACQVLNRTGSLDKLQFFKKLNDRKDVRLPPWTDSKEVAAQWLKDGYDAVVRHKLRGHSGQGIQIVHPGEDLPHAQLYTQYVKKKREFRVHIFRKYEKTFKGDVLAPDMVVHEKKGKRGVEKDFQVRNHANGYIYTRQPENVPGDVVDQAYQCFLALDLDFAAIDVIYNEKQDKAYVLEANTAPGLDGMTTDIYVKYFKERCNAV